MLGNTIEDNKIKTDVLVHIGTVQEIYFRDLESARKSYLSAIQLWPKNIDANLAYGMFLKSVDGNLVDVS